MEIEKYLDSTYLKTPQQSGLSDSETLVRVRKLAEEAIAHHFYAVMVRPDYVRSLRMLIDEENADLKLGTVIDFPEGKGSVEEKLKEARAAIVNGADELDFVVDFNAYKKGKIEKVKEEIEVCSQLVLRLDKLIKWIIETAALTDAEIAGLTHLIKEIVVEKLNKFPVENVFVKSSTGFFQTPNGEPNGANERVIEIMLKNAGPLPVKASGGVKSFQDAEKMIKKGVKRIGTSSALEIVTHKPEK